MAKYIFKNDFNAETKFQTSGNAMPPASLKKRFSKGDSIEGISFDNGLTISTTIEGKEPSGMVGQSYFAIPMVNLEEEAATTLTYIFTKDTTVLGSGIIRSSKTFSEGDLIEAGPEINGFVQFGAYKIPVGNLKVYEKMPEKTNAAGKKLMTNVVILIAMLAVLYLILKSDK